MPSMWTLIHLFMRRLVKSGEIEVTRMMHCIPDSDSSKKLIFRPF